MMYVILIVGFILLIKGADFFVEGSSSTAKMLKVPSLIIGMTIVAMGTSLPEASVSISASLAGKNSLSISNAVGSNLFNLMFVIGVCALFASVPVSRDTLKRDFPFSAIIAALLLGLGAVGNEISRFDGIILSVIFAAFLFVMVKSAMNSRKNGSAEQEEYKIIPVWKCIVFMIGGVAAIIIGGKMVVNGASDIARSFGMSDTLIGMTIVALGTSLPELVTSVVAVRKKEIDMALGNAVGSNIFNILFVLGIAAAISPMTFTTENLIDTAVLIGMTILVFFFCLSKKKLVRWQGAVMLLLYCAYTAYLFIR
ncbi:MAG: calcium/sodium antiporter [Ruminococcus sp.]|nr:calcium/sodium antiporter [Ruminococcus sp.]